MGGEPTVAATVDSFYDRMLADPEFEQWFRGIDLRRLKAHQRAFLAVGFGGPEAYSGRSMRSAHTGLAITDAAYTLAEDHLAAALTELLVEEDVVRQIIRRIDMMRAAIVETR